MKITVFGSGYVGLVTAACLAELSHDVLCVDVDTDKVARLQAGQVDRYEPQLPALVQKHIARGSLCFSADVPSAVNFGDLQFICVGTPSDASGAADLRDVKAVARSIGQHMQAHKWVINKSTVPVGSAQKVRHIIEEELSQRQQDLSFDVISNPEFLREGSAVNDFMYPDRVIVGSDSKAAHELMLQLYQPITDHARPVVQMDTRSAELSKYIANAMLACRISFMNEMANIAEIMGADITQVEYAIGLDPRIGPHFLKAGAGYGGSCFPKDVRALRYNASEHGIEPQMLNAVESINQRQKKRLYQKIKAYFNDNLQDKVIAVWGLAFKAHTDDMREAPSIDLINHLTQAGALIKAYDPEAMQQAQRLFTNNSQLQLCAEQTSCLTEADALVIVTEWPCFQTANLAELAHKLSGRVVFDGRNIYQPEDVTAVGLQYISIGR